MTCNAAILSTENNMKKIRLSITIFNGFTSIYYYDKDGSIGIFQKYTASSVDKIYQPSLIKECKYNTDKAYY